MGADVVFGGWVVCYGMDGWQVGIEEVSRGRV